MRRSLVRVLSLTLFIGLIMAANAFAAPPNNEKELPLFPGATVDANATSIAAESSANTVSENAAEYKKRRGESDGFSQDFSQILTAKETYYTVAAWPEDVFRFYVQKLAAARGEILNDGDEPVLAPLSATPVAYTVTPVEEKDLFTTRDRPSNAEGGPRTLHYDGALAKKIYDARKRTAEGWIDVAEFDWYVKAADSTVTALKLELQSRAFSWKDGKQTYTPLTQIRVNSRQTVRHHAWELRNPSLDDAAVAKFRAMYDAPPTEKTLGVALYPGAKFDFETMVSSWKPGMKGTLYQFQTADAAAKVVSFFEQKTGLKSGAANGGIAIVLKGPVTAPESFVWVRDLGGSMTLIIVAVGQGK